MSQKLIADRVGEKAREELKLLLKELFIEDIKRENSKTSNKINDDVGKIINKAKEAFSGIFDEKIDEIKKIYSDQSFLKKLDGIISQNCQMIKFARIIALLIITCIIFMIFILIKY